MLTGSKGTMPERCSMMQQFPRIWASHGITWGHITAINGQCKAKEKKNRLKQTAVFLEPFPNRACETGSDPNAILHKATRPVLLGA